MNWSDICAFLAVAQFGSLRKAAESLDVTQPTIARRLRSLETDIGLPLFERDRDGHRLTAAGAELLPEAHVIESAVLRLEHKALGLLGRLSETVRVGAGEWSAAVLARNLERIEGGPRIELLVGGPFPNEERLPEIRLSHGMPASGEGVTRRVGSISCAIYGTPRFADGRALPLADSDLATLPWLGFVTEQEHYATMRWLRGRMRDRPPAARLTDTTLMATAAAGGIGVAVLPCFVGDNNSRLVRLSTRLESLRADYWTLVHPDLARNAAVRTVVDWIVDSFRSIELSDHEQDH